MAPWLLPGEPSPGTARRTARDWVADTTVFAFAAWMWFTGNQDFPPPGVDFVPPWMVVVNPWIGALACLALWWRRRAPVALALALAPCLVVAASSLGAATVALLTVATHRHWSRACAFTALYLLIASYYALFAEPPGMSRMAVVGWTAMYFLVPLTLGLVVRANRLTMDSIRREARVREREHLVRLAETRRAEREQLAREMHDVLAHRISLLSVHAGALAYRTARAGDGQAPPLETAEVDEAVQVIQTNARLALDELGEVLSILRTDPPRPDSPGTAPAVPRGDDAHHSDLPRPEQAPSRPSGLDRLVAEARAAGQPVHVTSSGPLDGLRPSAQRTAYRVVQEALTNARKHAPGAAVTVRLDATEGTGLRVRVSNPVTPGPATPRPDGEPGSGYGLVGLAERLHLENGTLEHGISGGQFVLTAHLPW
ncbi:sensor histidine kinase [Nonomuraea sp. NPDC050663]|uniref:sensor histidine kinase n=1 Tax=Nonomuraea sp. NPDC050663 TaxID=3364370 RepID=UPI00379C1836